MAFQKATKHKMKLRCAIEGPPGSGKTYSALAIGRALVGENGRIALIDTERGSASKYSDDFNFDVVELDTFAPATFVEYIREAEADGYDLLIIDSLSHAWIGAEGMLEQVDKIAKRKQYSSNFPAWKDASPQERQLWDTMLGCNMHVIATLRTKTEYVIEEAVGRDGRRRSVPRKVGLAPIQREGLEYEFDVVAEMDMDHNFSVSKTRCKALTDQSFNRPSHQVAEILHEWLGEGAPEKPKRNGSKAKAAREPQPEPQHLPEVDTPRGDRLKYRNELIGSMKDHIRALRLPSAVGTHIINVRGYQKSTDMPDAALAEFVDQLGQLLVYREEQTLTFEHMVDRLQEMPDDGSDVLENLLKESAELAANAEHAPDAEPRDAEQQDLLV
jgi:DNA polymerase III delta prime subunit